MEAESWEDEFYYEIEERGVPGDWVFYEDENLCMEEKGAKYTQRTFGRFRCSQCKRRWNSAEVHVLFFISLNKYIQEGTVKMRIFRQECKKCSFPKLEVPEISYENITRIIKNLVNRILQVFYGEKKAKEDLKPEVYSKDMEGPHDKEHCEACKMMICKWQIVAPKKQTADWGGSSTQKKPTQKPQTNVKQYSAATTSSYVFPSTTIYPVYESDLRSTATYSGYKSNVPTPTSYRTEQFTRSSPQCKEEESSFPIVASLIAGIGALALWYFKR